jgi:DNA transformation protein
MRQENTPSETTSEGTSPVSTIRNLGPAMEQAFGNAGIHSAEVLRELGTDAAYATLLAAGRHRPHFIAYYCIEMGLHGRPWNDCKGDEKKRLRTRFDTIVARHEKSRPKHDDAFEAALDALGVIPAHRFSD